MSVLNIERVSTCVNNENIELALTENLSGTRILGNLNHNAVFNYKIALDHYLCILFPKHS